jgi:STE24 endopeptidase
MQLLLLLVVVATLALAENAPHRPVDDGGARLGFAVLGMLLIVGFAAATSGMVALGLRQEADRRARWLARFGQLRAIHVGLWMIVTGAILYLLGWPQLVRFNWRLADAFLADDLLILAPAVLPLILSWAAFYEVERALQAGATDDVPTRNGAGYLSFHIRHELGLLLAPVLLLLAARDGAAWLAPELLAGDLSPLVFAPPLAALLVGFQLLLKRVWPTEPLPPGALRERLEATAARRGLRLRDLLVWKTDGRVVNAVVTGLAPPVRYVIFTDALLAEFDDDELEAIFAHEAGHVRRAHLVSRVLALLLPVLLFLACRRAFPEAIAAQSDWLVRHGLSVALQGPVLLLLGVGSYALGVFGAYSRLLEHEADLFACQDASEIATAESSERFVAALEKLGRAAGLQRAAAGWLHPSIAQRAACLETLAAAPDCQRRFTRRLRALRHLILGLTLASVLCLLW